MVPKALTFKELKEQSGAVGLERMQHSLGFQLGKHKRKRLNIAVGKRIAKRTLLDSATNTKHQDKLFTRFQKAWNGLTEIQARERLRMLTILDTVCVVETKTILQAVERMEERLRRALSQEIKQIGILGVAEIEVVNLKLFAKEDEGDQARKGQVLSGLAQAAGLEITGKEHLALVHFHGIVDLGPNAAIMERKAHNVLRQTWQGSWCVELKCFFTEFSIRKNLRNIAEYVTKGGNEDLRYQKQFGRKSPEAMELAMAKQGYAESGEYDDHLGLSVGEVSVLVNVYDALMRRNAARDGYLFLGGTVIRNRYQAREQYRIWKSALTTQSRLQYQRWKSGLTTH